MGLENRRHIQLNSYKLTDGVWLSDFPGYNGASARTEELGYWQRILTDNTLYYQLQLTVPQGGKFNIKNKDFTIKQLLKIINDEKIKVTALDLRYYPLSKEEFSDIVDFAKTSDYLTKIKLPPYSISQNDFRDISNKLSNNFKELEITRASTSSSFLSSFLQLLGFKSRGLLATPLKKFNHPGHYLPQSLEVQSYIYQVDLDIGNVKYSLCDLSNIESTPHTAILTGASNLKSCIDNVVNNLKTSIKVRDYSGISFPNDTDFRFILGVIKECAQQKIPLAGLKIEKTLTPDQVGQLMFYIAHLDKLESIQFSDQTLEIIAPDQKQWFDTHQTTAKKNNRSLLANFFSAILAPFKSKGDTMVATAKNIQPERQEPRKMISTKKTLSENKKPTILNQFENNQQNKTTPSEDNSSLTTSSQKKPSPK